MTTNLITSPVGEIQFLAVNRPVNNSKGKEVYCIKLAFDNIKDAEFIEKIADINATKPVNGYTYRGKNKQVKEYLIKNNKTLVSAETLYEVPVYDKDGKKLEEIPMFFADSKGTAQMVVQPYTKSAKGGTINLIAVIIHNIESTNSTAGGDREARLAQLRAAITEATKSSE